MGVSGREEEVAAFIEEEIRPFTDEICYDNLGSLIGIKRGYGTNKKKIMVSAHMDEIGFCVVSIEENGLLKVRNVGGIGLHLTYGSRIKFRNGLIGVIGSDSPITEIKQEDMHLINVDIGAFSKEEALKWVQIGDMACYMGEYAELLDGNIASKAMDNRVGCYILIRALKEQKQPYHDIYYVFSVQEEVGLRGARTAADKIEPDEGIAVDITGSFDTPDCKGRCNTVLGRGAAIKIMDNSTICHQKIIEKMIRLCETNSIPYQRDVLRGAGTDAGAICTTHAGVKVGGISIPTRYGHSPNSIVNKEDVESCIRLLKVYVEET